MRKEILHQINVPKKILVYTLGKDHPAWLRLALGAGFITIGSAMPEVGIFFKALTGLTHAIGFVPLLETLMAMAEPPPAKCETC